MKKSWLWILAAAAVVYLIVKKKAAPGPDNGIPAAKNSVLSAAQLTGAQLSSGLTKAIQSTSTTASTGLAGYLDSLLGNGGGKRSSSGGASALPTGKLSLGGQFNFSQDKALVPTASAGDNIASFRESGGYDPNDTLSADQYGDFYDAGVGDQGTQEYNYDDNFGLSDYDFSEPAYYDSGEDGGGYSDYGGYGGDFYSDGYGDFDYWDDGGSDFDW